MRLTVAEHCAICLAADRSDLIICLVEVVRSCQVLPVRLDHIICLVAQELNFSDGAKTPLEGGDDDASDICEDTYVLYHVPLVVQSPYIPTFAVMRSHVELGEALTDGVENPLEDPC